MSTKGGGKSSNASQKGKNASETSSPDIDRVSHGVADLELDASQEEGWEVYVRKSKGRAGSNAGKQWVGQNNTPKAWTHPDAVQKSGMRNNNGSGRGNGNAWPTLPTDARRSAGRGNAKPQAFNQVAEVKNSTSFAPPLKQGWSWMSRAGPGQFSEKVAIGNQSQQYPENVPAESAKTHDDDDGDRDDFDSDIDEDLDFDDDVASDDFDSDCSEKSHETRKKNRWFKELFTCMDSLSVEQINDTERQWHCPACKGGPGAIDWYRGLQPLITHAKTKGSNRVKLHRELALLLEEELQRRGTSAILAGEAFGTWEGLNEMKEKDIVWPPIVVVMNTQHDKDENDKWIGMGNQELLDYFSEYAAVKPRHSYGPQGHRGMSVLIFEASAVGYLEAERLSKHFEDLGRDKNAWLRHRIPFYPGGKRQLYGYMAEMQDLDYFNQHSQGKSKLKFEIRSYLEMVVKQLKQMSEDNQQLIWFKNRVAKEQRHSKAVEEYNGILSEKLRKMSEESQVVRIRTKKHHEQNKEEMDHQEQFFKEQLTMIYDARNVKEDDFEKIQQEQREKVVQSQTNPPSVEDPGHRDEEILKFIKCQDKEMEEFVAEREKLMKIHEERKTALKRRQWEEEVALETELSEELNVLMAKYTPKQ